MKHTKEPWIVKDGRYPLGETGDYENWRAIEDASGQTVISLAEPDDDDDGNIERMVACVNALAGIEDPATFLADAAKMVEAIASYLDYTKGAFTHGQDCGCDPDVNYQEPDCCIRREMESALSTPLALAVKSKEKK